MLRIDTAGKLGARVANVTLPSYKIDAVAKACVCYVARFSMARI